MDPTTHVVNKRKNNEEKVEHDIESQKFFIAFEDRQAVLRYQLEEKDIQFESLFVPPDKREDDLEERILEKAYEYVHENNLNADPATKEEFLEQELPYI